MHKLKNYQEYVALARELTEHDRHYYDQSRPLISDYEYDQKMHALLEYEKAHPTEALSDSPSQRISETPTQGFQQKTHLAPMLSLNNTYSAQELEDFVERVYKLLQTREVSFCSELKMDGTSISLRYEQGRLSHAVTRGNGEVGDDVTANIKTIRNVPLQLQGSIFPQSIEIRAEVYMSLATFRALNAQREEDGLDLFANPRNAAAGSLKLLDPKEVARRKLSLIAYGVGEGQSPVPTQGELHTLLRQWGLPTADPQYIALCSNAQEILIFAERVQQKRDHLPFEIDGIVVKVNHLSLHPILGTTGKAPRYAIAYKFAPPQVVTRILDISVQVGRSGILTPVAELEPVLLAGSTISRATLHNEEEILRKDIRIGDQVWIEKGGDVIPKVVAVNLSHRSAASTPWHMPRHCPVCHTAVQRLAGEVAVRCPNPECTEQRIRSILHFASKHALDIEHLGEKVVEQLVAKKLVARISDLYTLDEKALSQLEGFKAKSIQNLLQSIDASRKCSLSRFIMGLGIKHVGVETAELLVEKIGDLKELLHVTEEQLLAIHGIGEKTAFAIAYFFKDPHHIEEIQRLLALGVSPSLPPPKPQGHLFSGKTFVLTGTLTNYTRESATLLIKERGGSVSNTINKNTDYLLLGENPGSKYQKALKLKIPILSESEFTKKL